jgi:hypothetical protein
MQPHIVRVNPESIVVGDGDFHVFSLEIFGENFGSTAEVAALGQGTAIETTRVSETELRAKVDAYGCGPFTIGLIVLNDSTSFHPGTASNVVPLAVVGKSSVVADSRDGIPF